MSSVQGEFESFLKEDDDYKYALIKFVHRGRKRKLEEVDLVPVDWMSLNEKGSLQTQFLESVDDEEDVKLLHDLAEKNVAAPEGWPNFPVKAVGRAYTSQEGLLKLEELKRKDHVFTENSDEDADELADKMKKMIKRRQLQAEAANLKKKFKHANDLKDAQDSAVGEDCSRSVHAPNSTPKISGQVLKPIDNDQNFLNAGNKPAAVNSGQDSKASSSRSNSTIQNSSTAIGQVKQAELESLIIGVENIELPVIDVSNVACENDFQKAVLTYFARLSQQMTELDERSQRNEKRLERIEVALEDISKSNKELDALDFKDRQGIEIPMNTLAAFEEFDKKLSTDVKLKKDLFAEFEMCLDKDLCINKTFSAILKKFLAKELILKFTALRESKNKEDDEQRLFEKTQFCKCMIGYIKVIRKNKLKSETPDGDIRKALSSVFSNVKKWK